MKRWRACGRLSSSQSTTARLSGLSPERATETTRKGPRGGRHVSGCVRIVPPGTAEAGTPSSACSQGTAHSAAKCELPDPVTTIDSTPSTDAASTARSARILSTVSAHVTGCCAISRTVCP